MPGCGTNRATRAAPLARAGCRMFYAVSRSLKCARSQRRRKRCKKRTDYTTVPLYDIRRAGMRSISLIGGGPMAYSFSWTLRPRKSCSRGRYTQVDCPIIHDAGPYQRRQGFLLRRPQRNHSVRHVKSMAELKKAARLIDCVQWS